MFLTPGFDIVNGGILSISSILEETARLKHIHGAETTMCTVPGDPLLLRYTKFRNQNRIYRFPQVLSYFGDLQYLMIHIPEYAIEKFLNNLKNQDYLKLSKIKGLHFNILLQNIDEFSEELSHPKYIERLKKLGNVTCTTAHEKYSTPEVRKRLGIPLHKLSWFLSPEQYNRRGYLEKENLMVVSPDSHPMKTKILTLIATRFSRLRIQVIQDLTYEEYKEIVSKAKWALTFGEGLDGYFVENVFSGGISFAVYEPAFFTGDFRSLRTVYTTSEILAEKINADIEDLDNESTYNDYQRKEFEICSKYFDHQKYVHNIRLFYEGKYTVK